MDAKSQMVLVVKTNKLGSDEGQVTEPTVAQNNNAALKKMQGASILLKVMQGGRWHHT